MLNPADLPDDIAALKALLVASEGRNLRKQDRIDQRGVKATLTEEAHPLQH